MNYMYIDVRHIPDIPETFRSVKKIMLDANAISHARIFLDETFRYLESIKRIDNMLYTVSWHIIVVDGDLTLNHKTYKYEDVKTVFERWVVKGLIEGDK